VSALAILAVALISIRSLERSPTEWATTNDFAHQAITAHRILNGDNPYLKPLTEDYAKYGFVNRPRIHEATNPPLLSLLIAPFALMPSPLGFWCWSLVQVVAILYALMTFCQLAGIQNGSLSMLGTILAALLAFPTIAHIEHGQSQGIMLGFVAAGLRCLKEGRGQAAALFWALATSIKLFLWPLGVLLLLSYRRFTAASYAAMVCALFLALPLLWVDISTVMSFFSTAVPAIQSCLFRFNAGIVLVTASVYTMQAFDVPAEVVRSIAPFVNILSTVLAAVATLLIARKGNVPMERAVAATLCIATICAPTGWNHYGIFFFPALILCLGDILTQRAPRVLNPVSLLLLLILTGLNRGRIRNLGVAEELISAWMGPCLGVVLTLLMLCWKGNQLPTGRPGTGEEPSSRPGAPGSIR